MLETGEPGANRLKRKRSEMSTSVYQSSITIPESPILRTAERVRNYLRETTEEIQMRLSQEEAEREKKRRRNLVDRWDNAQFPAVEPIPLTQPTEFNFVTDSRLRQKSVESELPSTERRPKRQKVEYTGLTVPEPFMFACEERAALRPTPKSVEPDKSKARIELDQSKSQMGPTIPQPFSFQVDERLAMRPKRHILTTAEKEEQELQNMPKFQARPVQWQDFQHQWKSQNVDHPTLTQPEVSFLSILSIFQFFSFFQSFSFFSIFFLIHFSSFLFLLLLNLFVLLSAFQIRNG